MATLYDIQPENTSCLFSRTETLNKELAQIYLSELVGFLP